MKVSIAGWVVDSSECLTGRTAERFVHLSGGLNKLKQFSAVCESGYSEECAAGRPAVALITAPSRRGAEQVLEGAGWTFESGWGNPPGTWRCPACTARLAGDQV